MARGLVRSWKQPIFVDFDQKITKNLLEEIIKKVHETGFTVVAIGSDCGPENVSLWNEANGYGITPERPYMINPVDGTSKIFWFPDAPHLLKNLRNHFLNGFKDTVTGDILNAEPIREMMSLNNSEVSSIHKLKVIHLAVSNAKKMNVRLAAELLSHSTATALKRYVSKSRDDVAHKTAEFVQLVNCWFDVMNSYKRFDALDQNCAYGVHLEQQDEILDRMAEYTSKLRCIFATKDGKQRVHPNLVTFQKGILISISATKQMLPYLTERYGIQYIITHRVNQDALENLFSQIRTRGGLNDHPSPMNCVYRLRLQILGRNFSDLKTQLNTTSEDDKATYLVAEVLKMAEIEVDKNPKDLHDIDFSDTMSDVSIGKPIANQPQMLPPHIEEDGIEYLAGWVAKKLHVSI
jgi:Transposase protein/87kDa Transposase